MSDDKMRDRLIELLYTIHSDKAIPTMGEIADYLISNDVVSVVRCRECKYRGELDCPMYHEELEDCDDGDYVYTDLVATDHTVDDGFCHRGKRDLNNLFYIKI